MAQHLGDFPTYEQMQEHNRLLALIAGKDASASVLDSIIPASITGENTTRLFWAWYAQAQDGTQDRYALLDRFFKGAAQGWSDKTYTLQSYSDTVSGESAMTPIDDLEGKTPGLLCTETSATYQHWMDEDPMYWYIRANAVSAADGTMNILYFEGESGFDITGEIAPVYTFKMAKWVRQWSSGSYNYISWRTAPASGYVPYPGDVDPQNHKRSMTWLPTFPGGLNAEGGLTSGAGKKPYIFKSANNGIVDARKVSAYEGLWNDCDTIAALHDWQFRHFNLENSNILEGCVNYNVQVTVAVAEEDVKRVVLTPEDGDKFIVGSNVEVGTHPEGTTNDRGQAGNKDITSCAKITSKETIEIDGVTYCAMYLDVDTSFTIPATGYVSTVAWDSGTTEDIPGHADGCLYNLTNGKTPIRVGGVEYLDGAYTVGLDPLYDVTAGSDADHFNYEVYECRDSVNLSGSITSNYVDTGIGKTDVMKGWNYVKRFVSTRLGILFPEEFGGGSTTYYKSAFLGSHSAGVRCPWRFGDLSDAGDAGLACEHGGSAPSASGWHSRPRLSGSGKKRGEWTA